MAAGLSDFPEKDTFTLVVQIHIALLSKLLAGGKEAEEGDEEGGSTLRLPKEIAAKREKLKIAHEQLRKLPLTHITWFEVLRRFMELSRESEEEKDKRDDGENNEEKDKGAEKDTKEEKVENEEEEFIKSALQKLAEKEYETLPLSHKLSLLEYLCYEVENTVEFREHIRHQVEMVEGLYKERWLEEQKVRKAKKALEEELQEKKKIQLLMEIEGEDATGSNEQATGGPSNAKENKKETTKDNKEEHGKQSDGAEYVLFLVAT